MDNEPLPFLRKNTEDKQAIAFLCARNSGGHPIGQKTFETIHKFVSKSR